MQKTDQIAVIGAGMAGLTAARALTDEGHSVVVFDKGRGLGGRMASRRRDGWRFDHGAIALRPTEDTFAAFVSDCAAHNHTARWDDANGWAGLPGISSVVKPTADGLTIHSKAEVTSLKPDTDGWQLLGPFEAANTRFDRLILAIPQPQALKLLEPWPHLQAQIAPAAIAPCWTLMLGFETPLPVDVTYANYAKGPISVIARETAKPDRTLPGDGWTIQASADWSKTHLEQAPSDIEPALLDAFFTTLDCAPSAPAISMVHRWRYALTSTALGQPFVHDDALGLSICGDWCLGHSAQDAFNSGRHLAATLISDK